MTVGLRVNRARISTSEGAHGSNRHGHHHQNYPTISQTAILIRANYLHAKHQGAYCQPFKSRTATWLATKALASPSSLCSQACCAGLHDKEKKKLPNFNYLEIPRSYPYSTVAV
eukprot:1487898-Pyramimonas_sp.AAC.2